MIYRYKDPELFSGWEKTDFKQYSGNLILWGAGKIGGVAAHCLKRQGIEFIAFCDIASDKWGTEFCGHKVVSPEELKENYQGAAVLITNVFHNSVKPMLLHKGFTKIFDCSSLFMQIDFSDYDFWMTPEYAIRNVEQYLAAIHTQVTNDNTIDQIFLNITTKCTLRCRDCSLFVAYISSPCNYKEDDIIKDFNTVLDCLGHVRIVNFYGGEPLLHPQLASMIRSLANEKRIDRISIITNGTLLPSKEVLLAMKEEERFLVRISNYGILSNKINELTELLNTNGIKYEMTNYAYWDEPSKIGLVKASPEELAAKFKLCTACNVLFLMNRRGYLCSTGSAVCTMGGFPDSPSNYLDLNQEKTWEEQREDVLEFIARPRKGIYMDACKYCSGNHCVQFENKVPVAEQVKELLTLEKLY